MKENKTRKTGLFGGTFDPVHHGHLCLAKEVIEKFQLDKIIFIPSHISPHKQRNSVTSSFHRLEMLNLAIRDKPLFELSDIELQRGKVSYTIDTLYAFRKRNPKTNFYLIMAVDIFHDLVTWKKYWEILKNCNFIVASRPGFSFNITDNFLKALGRESLSYHLKISSQDEYEYKRNDNGRSLNFFNLKQPKNISSQEIRKYIQKRMQIKNFLPPQVEHYIIENNLY